MATHKLDNYLRMYRKRSGLSQDDVAYLLGATSGPKACRYERFKRIPTLEHALECEALYGIPVKELFAGISIKAERAVRQRARILKKRLDANRHCSPHLSQLLGEVAPEKEHNIAA